MTDLEKITPEEYTQFLWSYYKNPMQDKTYGEAFLDTFYPDVADDALRNADHKLAQKIIMQDYVHFGDTDPYVDLHHRDA